MKNAYQERRDILVDGLNDIKGIKCVKPEGAMYVFPNIQGTGMSSNAFADFALEKAGIALLPGNNFGKAGEGYVRMCYVNSKKKIHDAIAILRNALSEQR